MFFQANRRLTGATISRKPGNVISAQKIVEHQFLRSVRPPQHTIALHVNEMGYKILDRAI